MRLRGKVARDLVATMPHRLRVGARHDHGRPGAAAVALAGAVAGDAMANPVANPVEAAELLDIEVDHLAGVLALVADHRRGRFEGAELVQPKPEEDPADRGGRDADRLGDLLAGPALTAEPLYRLVTTMLDLAQAPAAELAALYHEPWEIEGALAELKTQLSGAQVVLRSKTPELVRQEFWGLLLAHFAVRGLIYEAVLKADLD
jgi:hypothetical protein